MRSAQALLTALVASTRPRQWIKNLLVFAAPVAAGVLFDPLVLRSSLLALVCFVMASSATYLVNDVLDVDADRLHPVKRGRAIASGRLPVQAALAAAALLTAAALIASAVLGNAALTWTLLAFVVVQGIYQLWAKHQPVFDLASVAAGFVLRAVAGGVAADLYISNWFLTVTASGAMFVIAGKRFSELTTHGNSGTRRSLTYYSLGFLRFVWSVSAGVTVTFYALWAADIAGGGSGLAARLSTIPFSLILLRYARDVDAGTAEDPERILVKDPSLLALGVVWAALFLVEVLK